MTALTARICAVVALCWALSANCFAQGTGPVPVPLEPLRLILRSRPTLKDCKDDAARGPKLGSSMVERRTFEGYFRSTAVGTKLALVSDDGCKVTINDQPFSQIQRLGQNQAWEDANSFQVLNQPGSNQPLLFDPNQVYKIKVEYSNTIHNPTVNEKVDIDGLTLFAFDGGGTVASTSPVDLVIFNAQEGEPLGEDTEEAVGAFTVANMNNTDSSLAPNDADSGQNSVPGEKDLMQLVLHKPTGAADTDKVKLTIVSGKVNLWTSSTKGTLVLAGGSMDFQASQLDKTLWVEAWTGSERLRDIVLTLTWNNMTDTVKATAIWSTKTGFRNSNPPTTLTAAAINSNPRSNQIVVAAATGFAVDDHIIIFSVADQGRTRAGYDITAVSGTTLTLDRLGKWAAGDEVRQGMSGEIDEQKMIDTFVDGGGKLGSAHVLPLSTNAMEMQFMVMPAGIGSEPGVMFDISRQRATVMWQKNSTNWDPHSWNYPDGTVFSPCGFPPVDEYPNDDSFNNGQQDEDNTPKKNNHIYSRDMPNVTFSFAYVPAVIVRHNMYEFVRVKLDGEKFVNANGKVEGSRCSPKVPWHSRHHLVLDPLATEPDGLGSTRNLWMRANVRALDNSIDLGHFNLLPR